MRDNDVNPELLNDYFNFNIWNKYFSGEFSQDIEGLGGLSIWHKDIGYAQQVAHKNETALPLSSILQEAYKATMQQVDEKEGHAAALIKYWETLNNRQ